MKVAFPSVIAVEVVKKKWVNSEYILMVDPTEVPDGLDISAKGKKVGVMYDAKVFGLSSWFSSTSFLIYLIPLLFFICIVLCLFIFLQ